MGTAFEKAKAEGNAEEMERLIRESEMRKQGGAETIIINNNNVDNSVKSSSQTLTTQSITDPAMMVGGIINNLYLTITRLIQK